MRWFVPSALVAMTAALAAGCGSGASGSAGSTSASVGRSAAETSFIAQADAICRQANLELLKHEPKRSGIAEIARLTPVHAKIEQDAVNELGRLSAPAALAPRWRQVVAYRQTLATELAALGRAAKLRDTKGVQALGAAKLRVHRQLLAAGRRGGFVDCASL